MHHYIIAKILILLILVIRYRVKNFAKDIRRLINSSELLKNTVFKTYEKPIIISLTTTSKNLCL